MDADDVLHALRHVIDPEIGVNIVDLGLVYDVQVSDRHVAVRMTMTTPACPLGDALTSEAEAAIIRNVADARSVQVDLVWEPVWDPSMMSDVARQQLGRA